MYAVTRWRFKPFKNTIIRWFIRTFDVDMSIAKEPRPEHYIHFNDFFTRALVEDARPIVKDGDAIACPVDGCVSQVGRIEDGRLFQAKGYDYSLSELLAHDQGLVERVKDGQFATLYLSPKDYHRIHIPLAGRLQTMLHVPGPLFAVNQRTVRVVDGLFARNERVISVFETEVGQMMVIFVGAIFVGGMETVWHGELTPSKRRQPQTWRYDQDDRTPVAFNKGDEIGRFNMGSTVILLFEPGVMQWSANLAPGATIRMGQRVGSLIADNG